MIHVYNPVRIIKALLESRVVLRYPNFLQTGEGVKNVSHEVLCFAPYLRLEKVLLHLGATLKQGEAASLCAVVGWEGWGAFLLHTVSRMRHIPHTLLFDFFCTAESWNPGNMFASILAREPKRERFITCHFWTRTWMPLNVRQSNISILSCNSIHLGHRGHRMSAADSCCS